MRSRECLERLLEGRRIVVEMRLIQVDVVGLQPPQRIVDGLSRYRRPDSPLPAPMSQPTLVAITTLSRLPRLLQPLADDGLGFAALVAGRPARIDVGGIDEVEAGVDEGVEQAKEVLSSAVQPKTLPPNTSGAILSPDLPGRWGPLRAGAVHCER